MYLRTIKIHTAERAAKMPTMTFQPMVIPVFWTRVPQMRGKIKAAIAYVNCKDA